MIQIRDNTGVIRQTVESGAVEILDGDGNLAVVVALRKSGLVDILTPGDQLFSAYAYANRQKPAKVHIHKHLAVAAQV